MLFTRQHPGRCRCPLGLGPNQEGILDSTAALGRPSPIARPFSSQTQYWDKGSLDTRHTCSRDEAGQKSRGPSWRPVSACRRPRPSQGTRLLAREWPGLNIKVHQTSRRVGEFKCPVPVNTNMKPERGPEPRLPLPAQMASAVPSSREHYFFSSQAG